MEPRSACAVICDVQLDDEGLQALAADFQGYEDDLILSNGQPLPYPPGKDADNCLCAPDAVEADAPWPCSRNSGLCDCTDATGNFYDEQTDRLLLHALPSRLPLVECGPHCLCSLQTCALRVTQRGVRLNTAIQAIQNGKGLGLFAKDLAHIGDFLCLYAGELLDTAEATTRWQSRRDHLKELLPTGRGNYILTLKENGEVIGHVDATYKANIGRFINHSCDPNCVIYLVRWGVHSIPRPAIFLFKEVHPGEEFTFDYGDASSQDPLSFQDGEAEQQVNDRSPCHCGASVCRGFMPFDETL